MPAVLDGLVNDPPLVIVREAMLAVQFDLMVRPGTRAADIRRVASHWRGIAQTRGWIAERLPAAEVLLARPRPRPRPRSRAASWTRPWPRRWRPSSTGSTCSRPTSRTTRARSPASRCSGCPDRFPRPPATTARPSPPPPRTARLAAGAATELAVRGIGLTRIGARTIKERNAEYSVPPRLPRPRRRARRWAKRWPRCTAAATASASSAPTRVRPTGGRPASRAPR